VSGYAARRLADASGAVEAGNYPLALGIVADATEFLGSGEQAARALTLLEVVARHIDATKSHRLDEAKERAQAALDRFSTSYQRELLSVRVVRLVRLLLVDVGLDGTIDLAPVLPLFAQIGPSSELVPSEELQVRLGEWRER
jgi:hypothetical protein